MKTVVIGSKNPVKVAVTKEVFELTFPEETFSFVSISAESGVPDQPYGREEMKRGAQNRARFCAEQHPEGDFFVGHEGGVEIETDEYWATAWMCIMNASGLVGFGQAGSFLLPPPVVKQMKAGMELGHATDVVFGDDNSKHKGGAVAHVTNSLVDRQRFYHDALLFALAPFLNTSVYK